MNIFGYIDTFFSSLNKFTVMNDIFFIFIGLFLFTVLIVIISTSKSYEARLIKAIDMLNAYFVDNPQITEDNLVPFNMKMKTNKVPKQLRKQWQQFVLYREKKASEYMSYDSCVTIPIKNSTYTRDINILNSISWILAVLSFVVGIYMIIADDVVTVVCRASIIPAIIIVFNILVKIFLDLRHNAIISDLNQNYQYFEVNIDKATETLPEYVDYEVLFDRNEIKKGIPMLYAYLQKRAEMEKKELERARLKNVHHEQFNFDEAGVASSLVLDRAMQEAESYIAERKKLMQDIEQINSDITQEEMNFREITKEYQRQMQVSKETFDNFKAQLEDASSTIEINYLKKQQQQELDRQRNLERDFDTASDRNKKILQSYQEELNGVENEIKKARNTLERGMMSEFQTYSGKVYDEAVKTVQANQQKKFEEMKNTIKELEERLVAKNNELESFYNAQTSEGYPLPQPGMVTKINTPTPKTPRPAPVVNTPEPQPVYSEQEPVVMNKELFDINQPTTEYADENAEPIHEEFDYQAEEEDLADYGTLEDEAFDYQDDAEEYPEDQGFDYQTEDSEEFDYQSEEPVEADQPEEPVNNFNFTEESTRDFDYTDEEDEGEEGEELDVDLAEEESDEGDMLEDDFTMPEEESIARELRIPVVAKPVENKPVVAQPVEPKPQQNKPVEAAPVVRKSPGRPRKPVVESKEPKRKAGRPRKVVTEPVVKKSPGRPRKEVVEPVVKKGPGRPKKEIVAAVAKKGPGRPKKEVSQPTVTKKRPGRPKKNSNVRDIEAYLREIDDEIAKESAKLKASEEQLAKISKRK